MKTPIAVRTLAPLGLLVMLAACDRPHAPPPPTAVASPAAPSTVSLSGAILEPQVNPVPARPGKTGALKMAPGRARATTSTSGGSGVGNRDNGALRDFQAEQEQRDRELLERDMDEARTTASDDRDVRDDRDDRNDREPYDLPPEDGDWTAADDGPLDNDEMIDDPSAYDEPPLDDEPPADDRYYDPRDSGYRP